ncbi:MAG: V-type ATP synthase subunit K [Clostridia bacterium]|nr:V-type ATP synthase subunit K [Clostridia bacterium]MBR2926227.1 V-type ATP synthase subunit K [Clostridia bacterium]
MTLITALNATAEPTVTSALIEFLQQIFTGNNLAILGAALATFLTGIGSAKGVNLVAKATAGLMTEDPSKYGKSMLLQALPMTQGIYGLVTAFMILVTSGIMGGTANLTVGQGAAYLFSALPIAISGLYSAIKQGEVAAAGVAVLAKRPEAVGKAVISASFVELYAILGLLISLLLVL